jgi:putative membrane protein
MLKDRLITVIGFALPQTNGVDLGRVVIICCAADAQLARIHLRGPAIAELKNYPRKRG